MNKYIILIAIAFVFIGCNDKPHNKLTYKYKVGDKVHILIDNRPAVIQRINYDSYPNQGYLIGYKDDDGDYVKHTMEEFNLTK